MPELRLALGVTSGSLSRNLAPLRMRGLVAPRRADLTVYYRKTEHWLWQALEATCLGHLRVALGGAVAAAESAAGPRSQPPAR